MNVLFFNTQKANCSIYESGRMVYDALKYGHQSYHIDYMEHPDPVYEYFDKYDVIIVNYHHQTTPYINPRVFGDIKVPVYTIVTECLPNDPLPLTPKWFDGYLILDPTVKDHDNIYGMPRPLEPYVPKKRSSREIPVIGSFGFATAGKRFDLVVEEVNKNFEQAKIRFNFPTATYVPGNAEISLANSLKNKAKSGIDLEITHEYFSKRELIEWCDDNDLNVFFYYRNMTGLAAVTDQAISARRPILVTDDYTFRHIHAYMKPYPEISIKEALHMIEPVKQMYNDWHPMNFAEKFESIIKK